MRLFLIVAVSMLAACDGYHGGTADEVTFDRALSNEEIIRQASVTGAPGAISAIAFAREGGAFTDDAETYFALSTIRGPVETGAALSGNARYDGTWAVAGWQDAEVFADTGAITLDADFASGTLTGVGNNGLSGDAFGRLVVDAVFLGTAVEGEVTYTSGRLEDTMSGSVDNAIGTAYSLNSGLPSTPSSIGEDGVVFVFAGDATNGPTAPFALAGGVVAEPLP